MGLGDCEWEDFSGEGRLPRVKKVKIFLRTESFEAEERNEEDDDGSDG